jgi:SAM-dependent methyltransferase
VLKFNMGCGLNHRPGYVNVDASAECRPDEVVDLEATPWPWADNCADEVRFIHALEHMGGESRVFLGLMRELYRICAPGAAVVIHVPHPRHDNFLNDPTHVRPITPQILNLFDREANEDWRRLGAANTPLALYTGVDFKVAEVQTVLAEPYMTQLREQRITPAEIEEAVRARNNVIEEWRLTLLVRK